MEQLSDSSRHQQQGVLSSHGYLMYSSYRLLGDELVQLDLPRQLSVVVAHLGQLLVCAKPKDKSPVLSCYYGTCISTYSQIMLSYLAVFQAGFYGVDHMIEIMEKLVNRCFQQLSELQESLCLTSLHLRMTLLHCLQAVESEASIVSVKGWHGTCSYRGSLAVIRKRYNAWAERLVRCAVRIPTAESTIGLQAKRVDTSIESKRKGVGLASTDRYDFLAFQRGYQPWPGNEIVLDFGVLQSVGLSVTRALTSRCKPPSGQAAFTIPLA